MSRKEKARLAPGFFPTHARRLLREGEGATHGLRLRHGLKAPATHGGLHASLEHAARAGADDIDVADAAVRVDDELEHDLASLALAQRVRGIRRLRRADGDERAARARRAGRRRRGGRRRCRGGGRRRRGGGRRRRRGRGGGGRARRGGGGAIGGFLLGGEFGGARLGILGGLGLLF